MPAVKEPEFVTRLASNLHSSLKLAGIQSVQVKAMRVPATKLYRVSVISKGFRNLPPTERQDLVWRIASEKLSRGEQFRISTIQTFTPSEIGQTPARTRRKALAVAS